MFTGIIEEVGTIRELRAASGGAMLKVAADTVARGLKTGDSVAVNGVCLTATQTGAGFFYCDISSETLRISTFGKARPGMRVNLERSLIFGDRLGGHFVQGHVDGMGRLADRRPSGDGMEMSFAFPKELDRYLVYKGSVAVDGISLTVSKLEPGLFSVAVIPHTLKSTNLGLLDIGDEVNLETDVLGRYVERLLRAVLDQPEKTQRVWTEQYLKSQGF